MSAKYSQNSFNLKDELTELEYELSYLTDYTPLPPHDKENLAQRFSAFPRLIRQNMKANPSQANFCLRILDSIRRSMKKPPMSTDGKDNPKELAQRFNQERIFVFIQLVRQRQDIIRQKWESDPSQWTEYFTLLNAIINSMKQLELPTDDMESLRSYLQQLSEPKKIPAKRKRHPSPPRMSFNLEQKLDYLANFIDTLCSNPAQALKTHPELRDTNINDEMIPALLTSVYQNLNDIRLELRPKSPELAAAIKKCDDIIISLYEYRFESEFIRRLKYLLQTMDAADPYSPAWEADVLLSQFKKQGEIFELRNLIANQKNYPSFLTYIEQELSRANILISYLIEPLTFCPGCIRQRGKSNKPRLSTLINTCNRIIQPLQKSNLDTAVLERLRQLLQEADEATTTISEDTPKPAPADTTVHAPTDTKVFERTDTKISASTDTSAAPSTDTSAIVSTNTSATASTNTSATPSTSTSVTASADTNSR